MLAGERREQFKADVAQMKLKTGTSRNDTLLMVVGAIARVLRVWLLRQLYEGQAHVDQLTAAVRER